ncbi:MAG: leucyl/phenylalanyl-tRNA--protein transferase [Hyphomicrobiales bacterium]
MPVYLLSEEPYFPNPSEAEEDGCLAIGGDLSTIRLINAYYNGIFPWYNEGEDIMWFSPDPRLVIYPNEFKASKSLRKIITKNTFDVKINSDFEQTIQNCAFISRQDQDGTWINKDMIQAYINLHHEGWAHSIEVYENSELIGGLYGILLGNVFFGESMFHKKSNASKVAFYHLIEKCKESNISLIDAQQDTPHMRSLGGKLIERRRFIDTIHTLITPENLQNNFRF